MAKATRKKGTVMAAEAPFPDTVSKAVAAREIVKKLGVEASGNDIIAAFNKAYPQFKDKLASSEIRSAKLKVAEEKGITLPGRGKGKGKVEKGSGFLPDFTAAKRFVAEIADGDSAKAVEILKSIKEFGSIDELSGVLSKYDQMLQQVGGKEEVLDGLLEIMRKK